MLHVAKSATVKYSDVFVPGGFPTYTYNPRESRQLEDTIREVTDSHKLLVVTGPTKSGKTVLVNKVFPSNENLWIDGGAISSEESFWELIVSALDGYTEEQIENGEDLQYTISGESEMEGNILLARAKAGLAGTIASTGRTTILQRRAMSNKNKAISLLQETKIPLIIDDFHYISRDIQKSIVRALKALIMHGVPVICIAIPNRKFDVIEVERELTGRMTSIEMPVWDLPELEIIAKNGFIALNTKIDDKKIAEFAIEAFGSPFLMQEFCHTICKKSGISEKKKHQQYIDNTYNLDEIFAEIANNSGRSMFEKLKRGPRTRTDRKPRKMKSGAVLDIYGVVMEALQHLRPGIETITYDTLRANIREVLADDLPQHGEIARVLEKIAEISHTDTSSTPVIDWQKDDDILTITDPFFAFFLKWSKE